MKPITEITSIITKQLSCIPYFNFIVLLLCSVLLFQSCKKHDFNPPPVGAYDLQLVTDGLTSPLVLTEAPDGTHRLFVADQTGKIWILNADGSKMSEPFIDISSKLPALSPFYDERGLLGFAFHPNFKSNGKFYLFYTAPPRAGGPEPGVSWDNLTRISEFRVSANPNKADMASERVIMEEDHPQMNHDGGTIAFGPDGYLYISIGDGGGAGDIDPGHVDDWYAVNAGGNGQDITHNRMGNILRIDVNSTWGKMNYGIPADNPFVGTDAKAEIYAYGFRNPYRFSFDMGDDHKLYVGDAGQSLYEEIDIVTKGGNYGWNVKEGTHCFNTDDFFTERAACPMEDTAGNPLIDPIIEQPNYANPKGGITLVIVGGNVYRGKSIPFLYGKYIFGSLSADDEEAAGKLYLGKPAASGLWGYEELKLKSFPDDLGQYVKSFGQDLNGEVYVMTSGQLGPMGNTGKVYKLVYGVRK
ncbi:PQQ-dependent sugar dehydrogenase [Ilyomonas limi]|uniref:PQQ-dependent sugar dehydrogenase n=1 Tax=Ilyomonas limi TaxID=2575867 RepID=A0A4U3L4U4_9BACT|nr:PQQ-dependent sugar dehydrogenase [Ilyomonas limi]TKK70168.1 PQQ-dependent sugar dehydrogenase [Ilyomonas limi]